ncbi:MAG: GTP cyclohydrolase FolE2 [Treponemataceae bacterium]|nr:GTP cyclohydrolase FolE2 [Treponemataceae bacterium]
MIDIQSEEDTRNVPLEKVGVRNLSYPVQVLDKRHKTQATTAAVDLFVNLPHRYKGTHMSRFIEIFHKHCKNLTMNHFLEMLEEIRGRLDAQHAYGIMRFPFFMEKTAPVSGAAGVMRYDCTYEGSVGADGRQFFVSVEVPVTTVCPCSKAISDYGAHNQRGTVRVKVLYSGFFWIEDVIRMVEESASGGLYSVLKRSDEKFVTERAYDNPRFVEDVVREVYLGLRGFPVASPFPWFSVEAENFESIHNHNAYAYTEYGARRAVQECR